MVLNWENDYCVYVVVRGAVLWLVLGESRKWYCLSVLVMVALTRDIDDNSGTPRFTHVFISEKLLKFESPECCQIGNLLNSNT